MPTTIDYINQLKVDKQTLVYSLIQKGIEANEEETFTDLVPKVLDIQISNEELEKSYISSIDDSLGANITKLPDKITKIGDYAFFRKTGLKINRLEQEITDIGTSAFNGCSNLDLSEISSSVLDTINATAFATAGIKELDVKSSVLDIIGNNAFQNSDLEKIIIRRNDRLVTARTTIFSGTPISKGNGYIYVPDELVEQYKVASNWSVYASQIKGVSEL